MASGNSALVSIKMLELEGLGEWCFGSWSNREHFEPQNAAPVSGQQSDF